MRFVLPTQFPTRLWRKEYFSDGWMFVIRCKSSELELSQRVKTAKVVYPGPDKLPSRFDFWICELGYGRKINARSGNWTICLHDFSIPYTRVNLSVPISMVYTSKYSVFFNDWLWFFIFFTNQEINKRHKKNKDLYVKYLESYIFKQKLI